MDTDTAFTAWLARFRAACRREPSQTERMAAYGYILRNHATGACSSLCCTA